MIIPSELEQKLRELQKAFLEENKKVNLSAYRDEEQCWVGNVLDSIEGGSVISSELDESRKKKEEGNLRILDLGTGGGFPLLPLAIMFPNVPFTGIDATNKKIEAVKRIVEKMDLKNVELVSGRVEELGYEARYREEFDFVLGRAVAPMNVLLEYMSPFCKPLGKMLCWKSMNCEDELTESVDARIQLKCRLIDRYAYSLDEAIGLPTEVQSQELEVRNKESGFDKSNMRVSWGRRQILVLEKTDVISKKFPRGIGEAKKNPL